MFHHTKLKLLYLLEEQKKKKSILQYNINAKTLVMIYRLKAKASVEVRDSFVKKNQTGIYQDS